jgi:hypothetical protein
MVAVPRDKPVMRLRTYGADETGETPMSAFTDKAMPRASTNRPRTYMNPFFNQIGFMPDIADLLVRMRRFLLS